MATQYYYVSIWTRCRPHESFFYLCISGNELTKCGYKGGSGHFCYNSLDCEKDRMVVVLANSPVSYSMLQECFR